MNRSKFIKQLSAGVLLPNVLQGFSMNAFAASPLMHHQVQLLSANTDNVLVLVRLEGGNDGLNTVIPLDKYSELNAQRGNIIIPQNQVLPLTGNNTIGLHPSMTGMQHLYNEGKLKIVQSVAYPNQSQSHFRSNDIWMSASDYNTYPGTGFAGRYLDYKYPGYPTGYPNNVMPDPLGIEIASGKSLLFEGASFGTSIPIENTNAFYNLLNGIQTPVPNTTGGEQLTYIRTIQRQSNAYSNAIVNAANNVTTQSNYPQTDIAQALKIVARLIGGGLKTKIYMVSMGGYDTHANQVNEHANLLGQLSAAIKAFMDDVAFLGAGSNVMGMTFSEFGRRINSSASLGTDHGIAAPVFVFGNKVAGGVLGVTPDINGDVASNDSNVSMQFDFRSLYTTILKDWFCVPSNDLPSIMLNSFNTLPVLQPSAGCNVSLPVNLMLFTGRLVNEASQLDWRTSYDVNFDYFELEYSASGQGFGFLAKVSRKGNPGQVTDYGYRHDGIREGLNHYRLKMVDKDGTYTYSDIVVVRLSHQQNTITLYPNPVINVFRLGTAVAVTEIQLYGINGTLLRRVKYAAGTSIDISDFRKGVYVWKCFDGGRLLGSGELIKQ